MPSHSGSKHRKRWIALGSVGLALGLPTAAYFGWVSPEYVDGFSPEKGTSKGDFPGKCMALATIGNFLSGVIIIGSSFRLLVSSDGRLPAIAGCLLGAGLISLVTAGVAFGGAWFGASKGGMQEACLIILFFPPALVLSAFSFLGSFLIRRFSD